MELVGERQADLDEPGPECLDRPVQPSLTGEALAALCWLGHVVFSAVAGPACWPPSRVWIGGRVLHPIGAGVVEPGAEVKLRRHDVLGWQRLHASRVLLVWRGQVKRSCGFSRCLTAVDGGIRSAGG
jgi:hypothetical protein